MTALDPASQRSLVIRYLVVLASGIILNSLILRDWLGVTNQVRFPIVILVTGLATFLVIPRLWRQKAVRRFVLLFTVLFAGLALVAILSIFGSLS